MAWTKTTRVEYARRGGRYASDLTDREWALLEAFIPPARHGHPKSIRVDLGPEFISRDLDLWAYANGVELDFSRPGKPPDNAFIESLNGKFRAECLNAHWFMNLADARGKCER